jgi:hypothetical protein
MKNLPKLIDAIFESWTRCLLPPYGDGTYSAFIDNQTDCNRFVNEVAIKLGYSKFAGLRASYIVALAKKEWLEVSGEKAQALANEGNFVIAGWINPNPNEPGHVCVVRPGNTVVSGKWGPGVPMVANVGRPEQCRADKGANYAFKFQPQYFVLPEVANAGK